MNVDTVVASERDKVSTLDQDVKDVCSIPAQVQYFPSSSPHHDIGCHGLGPAQAVCCMVVGLNLCMNEYVYLFVVVLHPSNI